MKNVMLTCMYEITCNFKEKTSNESAVHNQR